MTIDRALFAALNGGAANPALDWLMPRLTNLHQRAWFFIPVLLLCAFLAVRGSRRTRTWIACALVAVGLSDLTAARVLKPLVPRDRPCYRPAPTAPTSVPDVRLVPGEHCPGSRSFPSNHASNMMALAGVCWWFSRRRGHPSTVPNSTGDLLATPDAFADAQKPNGAGTPAETGWSGAAPWLWFLLPLVIGYSRIYLGYHYPSDVLGGWIWGGIVAAAVITAVCRVSGERGDGKVTR